MIKNIIILMILMIAYPVNAINAMNAPSSSVQDRVQNSIKQESNERHGPFTEDELEDIIICKEKVAKYASKVIKYQNKVATDRRYDWRLKYYTKRLNWWKKYCAE